MRRKKKAVKPLGTIWQVSDELWAKIEPILREDSPAPPPVKGGRKRIDWWRAFNEIIFRMRTIGGRDDKYYSSRDFALPRPPR